LCSLFIYVLFWPRFGKKKWIVALLICHLFISKRHTNNMYHSFWCFTVNYSHFLSFFVMEFWFWNKCSVICFFSKDEQGATASPTKQSKQSRTDSKVSVEVMLLLKTVIKRNSACTICLMVEQNYNVASDFTFKKLIQLLWDCCKTALQISLVFFMCIFIFVLFICISS